MKSVVAIAALLVVAIIAGAGVGYLLGYNNRQSVTTTNTSTWTVTETTTSTRTLAQTTGYGVCSGTSVEFQAIPVNFIHMPVLLMRPNTAAVVCITYRDGWNGNSSEFSYWPDSFQNSPFFFPTLISKATCTSTAQYSGCFYNDSHSFNVVAYPNPIRPEASVAEVTVAYSVFALPNATGFYDHTFVYACESPRLAVGYSASQVNSSDFATIIVHSCFNAPYVPVSLTVSGMNVTYVGINTSGP